MEEQISALSMKIDQCKNCKGSVRHLIFNPVGRRMAKQSVHRDAIIDPYKRAVSTFKSLNCALCSTPYSKTANEVNTPTQTWCYDIQTVCMKCHEEQGAIAPVIRAHQCKDHNCFLIMAHPSYCLMELLSSGCFTLDQNLMGYVQTKSITIPECPVCNEEYSIENSQREPFILQCGHGICNGCFAQMSKRKTISFFNFKYVLECPQCTQNWTYAQESWENPLKMLLRELSEKRQIELKRTCGDCKKEAPLLEMFQCNDCGEVMLCSLFGEVKKLMNATCEVITPQIEAYDVCFPELQADLIKNIHNFQAKALEKAGKIEGLNYDPAEYEKADCLAIAGKFEGICEKYLGDLRSCNTGIEKLLSKFDETKETS
ncbi:unnamed protein product, partial [Mesorhabditis belari]|uniref:RING-type domain-containing protein n=1 Tax=Mesorhabditis belari TaxID=2138241 RepID=A0AAF3EQ32_9BILA